MRLRSLTALALLTALAFPAWGAIAPDAPIWANREWERLPDKAHEGQDTITALFDAFPARPVGLAVIQNVDPAQGDQLVGASVLKFNGHARWGWQAYGNLLAPEIVLASNPAAKVTRGALRELDILESQGDRVMADFVWPVLVGAEQRGMFVLRCVFFATEPSWLYARSFVAGDPDLTLKAVSLSSFGGFVSYAPGAVQWIVGEKTEGLAPARGPLALDEYWFFAAHQAHAAEWIMTRASAGVFLPEQLAQLEYQGQGSLRLAAAPGSRGLSWTISDFNAPPAEWIPATRATNAERQKRLAGMQWHPDMARELQLLDASAQPLLKSLDAQSPAVVAWQEKREALGAVVQAAQAAEPCSYEELAYGTAIQGARLALEALWPQAVTELIPSGAAE